MKNKLLTINNFLKLISGCFKGKNLATYLLLLILPVLGLTGCQVQQPASVSQDEVAEFTDTFFVVQIGLGTQRKTGLMNTSGEFIIPPDNNSIQYHAFNADRGIICFLGQNYGSFYAIHYYYYNTRTKEVEVNFFDEDPIHPVHPFYPYFLLNTGHSGHKLVNDKMEILTDQKFRRGMKFEETDLKGVYHLGRGVFSTHNDKYYPEYRIMHVLPDEDLVFVDSTTRNSNDKFYLIFNTKLEPADLPVNNISFSQYQNLKKFDRTFININGKIQMVDGRGNVIRTFSDSIQNAKMLTYDYGSISTGKRWPFRGISVVDRTGNIVLDSLSRADTVRGHVVVTEPTIAKFLVNDTLYETNMGTTSLRTRSSPDLKFIYQTLRRDSSRVIDLRTGEILFPYTDQSLKFNGYLLEFRECEHAREPDSIFNFRTGEMIVPDHSDWINGYEIFSANPCRKSDFGVKNPEGEIIFEPIYRHHIFGNYIRLQRSEYSFDLRRNFFYVTLFNVKTGEILFRDIPNDHLGFIHEIGNSKVIPVKNQGRGIIDNDSSRGWYLYDLYNSKKLINKHFEEISTTGDGLIKVKENNQYAIIDEHGNVVVPFGDEDIVAYMLTDTSGSYQGVIHYRVKKDITLRDFKNFINCLELQIDCDFEPTRGIMDFNRNKITPPIFEHISVWFIRENGSIKTSSFGQ